MIKDPPDFVYVGCVYWYLLYLKSKARYFSDIHINLVIRVVLNLQLMMLNKRQLNPLFCFCIQSPATSCGLWKMQLYTQREKINKVLVLLWEKYDLADILKGWQRPKRVLELYFKDQWATNIVCPRYFQIFTYINILHIDIDFLG